MRKTLYAMVGLLALGAWALPALAEDIDLPKVQEPVPVEARAGRFGDMLRAGNAAYRGTLSGTVIKQSQAATTSWFLYPGACQDRAHGTWAPYTLGPVADSLNTYNPLTQDHGYELEDQSLNERLWHIDDGSTKVGVFPLPIDGARSLWCGKTDPTFIIKSGYPNLTYQILYIDTDVRAAGGGAARSAPYNLSWTQNLSSELTYDFMYVIAGVGGAKDPIGNSRVDLDAIVASGSTAKGELLASFTGVQVALATTIPYTSGGVTVKGVGSGTPVTGTVTITGIPAADRAMYLLFHSDCLCSSEDGCWPDGHGPILDLVGASDQTALLYDDQTTAGGTDSFAGDVLVGTPGNPLISARVAPGVGTLWQVMAGNNLPESDFCNPQKSLAADIEFFGGDATLKTTIPNTFASIRSCTFGVPVGVASILAVWDEYLDLPSASGMTQSCDYRVYKNGQWGAWANTRGGDIVQTGALQAWTFDFNELAAATQADSFQIRYNMQCIGFFAVDHVNCQPVTYGILYDDFRMQVLTGVPAPVFTAFAADVAQSNFVDGTDPASVNCSASQISAGQCWPGIRGSNNGLPNAVHDNINSPLGDSLLITSTTGVRLNGMGNNWKEGFDKSVNAGMTIAHTNNSFNAAKDVPRIIFRLYDPTRAAAGLQAWSPFDSSQLDADNVTVAADTVVVKNRFRWNWPPRDKLLAGASLPGGWSINGKTLYSQLAFLPKGCRMQYYFKCVDIVGTGTQGVSYSFSSDNLAFEVEDLPRTPGVGGVTVPDIIETDILPRVYPPGAATTLLDGKTSSPILNLDNAFSTWSNGFDPVTQALRALGVRADRLRVLAALGEGNNIGGHELPGQRQARLSNYFPNVTEYGILTTLANNYRIMIQSSHLHTSTSMEEQDAILVHNWWNTETGTDGGDRCIFASGDDFFNALLNASLSFPQHTQQVSLAQDVFGVASCIGAWTGANSTQYPTITDNFAGITYPLDGGCPNPNRFDGLTSKGQAGVDAAAATFPGGVSELAAHARSIENDGTPDNDRSKALGYGFSIQFIRSAGYPPTQANYTHTGVENRMRVLYKFLTSCRGLRTPSQTTVCWPCPSSFSDITGNWATATTNFNTAAAGPLYAIQDNTQATGVEIPEAPKVNRLDGNFPNPFNPETAIRFTAATPGKVTIRVFDVAGRVVNTLSKNVTETGINEIRWNGKTQDGRQLASGVYFYRIRFANGQESEAKMTMLK